MDIDVKKMDFFKFKYYFKKNVWTQGLGPSFISRSFEPIMMPYGIIIRSVWSSVAGNKRTMDILPEQIDLAQEINGEKLLDTLSRYDSVKEYSIVIHPEKDESFPVKRVDLEGGTIVFIFRNTKKLHGEGCFPPEKKFIEHTFRNGKLDSIRYI